MSEATDVLVIGSGPAGIAAAFPLVQGGVRTWVVDGGEAPSLDVPDGEYLALRQHDAGQARWLLGDDAHALREGQASSPKLRAPTLAYAFRDYAQANNVRSEGFALVGSLAVGGLSNAWGCGVARFAADEWGDAPIDAGELDAAYRAVAARVGLSGACDDDLAPFFGVDALARGAVGLDALHTALAQRHARFRASLAGQGFRLGRARLAVLGEDVSVSRRACDARGLCLWGCPRRSMYSSRFDLPALARHATFRHLPGRIVERLERDALGWRALVRCRDGTRETLAARRIVLAAGTIASTALALRSLPQVRSVPLAHLPMAAFALWLPRFTGVAGASGPGVAQLAFTLDGSRAGEVCGFSFATHGLPVSEFLRHAPLSAAAGATLFRALLPSCIVANCFLPSSFSRSRVEMHADGQAVVVGAEAPELAGYAEDVRRRLAAAFRACGARMLPGSFRRGVLGADVHYAGTLPMRAAPAVGEADADGEIAGLPGVHVVDGAALPALPAKSHTLAIMANSHRIGARLARRLRDG